MPECGRKSFRYHNLPFMSDQTVSSQLEACFGVDAKIISEDCFHSPSLAAVVLYVTYSEVVHGRWYCWSFVGTKRRQILQQSATHDHAGSLVSAQARTTLVVVPGGGA